MEKLIAAAMAVAALSGCASVLNDTTHPMRIDTMTSSGEAVSGAECTIANDKDHTTARSGETVQVRRSSKDLEIVCTHEGLPNASGRAISRTNAGMWGNILLGGAVGAIVDHNKGTAYTYPTWVQLIFGRALTFDRRDEEEGEPVTAKDAGSAPTAGDAVVSAADRGAEATPVDAATPTVAPAEGAADR